MNEVNSIKKKKKTERNNLQSNHIENLTNIK